MRPALTGDMLNVTLLIASYAHHYSCHDVNMWNLHTSNKNHNWDIMILNVLEEIRYCS